MTPTDLIGPDLDKRFEIYDFESLDELLSPSGGVAPLPISPPPGSQ
jgi:hypothetical protein